MRGFVLAAAAAAIFSMAGCAAGGAPANIRLGMTPGEIRGELGEPEKIVRGRDGAAGMEKWEYRELTIYLDENGVYRWETVPRFPRKR